MHNDTRIIEWTSDSGGAATVDLEPGYAGKKLNWVKTVPGSGVSSYDLTLVDSDDFDWLISEGASRSTSAAEILFAQSNVVLPNEPLSLVVANAGDTKTGTVKMSIER